YVRERTLGALVAYRFEEPQDFTPNDLLLFEELGRHASIAIENARIFAREHEVAATLQRTLLPARLPVLDGWDLSASYAPGAPDASVGGDWYDAFVLPSGECVFTVGDVTGRGLAAATIMGTIRQALANIALYESDPARLLDAADRVLNERHPEALVTAFVAIVDTAHRTLRYANAGHPFPYVRTGDGGVEELEARGLPLGIRGLGPPAESRERTLEDAALVVFFTDGLVEATRDLSQGVARLRSVLQTEAAIAVAEPAATIARACRVGVEEARDDVAILALRPRAFARWTFEAPNAVSAEHARAEFVAYLRTQDENGSSLDLESAEAIFGELVSNVVRHAPGPIEITLELRAPHPVLHVLDSGPPFADPAVLPIDLYAEGGRGLYVIAKLAASVRLETLLGIGNHIAVELPLRSGQGSAPRVPSAPAELEMR
ncbi:MAG: SpoIIE family protein phosphatase, partial [Candidatus Eremiobacteraeota bacterium]|nr:SpoIIE family protein phosphatase [Candidatus Eremiobacteraeota bacterium]